ncbi:hypothetical protein C8J56DRAFT_926217 [Mycena floridula]|nr:hypothetical protein C8J56DRAFT_926217 [Mycena floridula]
MTRFSFLSQEEPVEALCHHFNVLKTELKTLQSSVTLPETFDMPVIRNTHLPTHVFALFQTSDPNTKPVMTPVQAERYITGFDRAPPPGLDVSTRKPVPHRSVDAPWDIISLPVIRLTVPHLASFPLILLFAFGLEKSDLLDWRLLPADVVEEFPNAADMAGVMSRLSDQEFRKYLQFNQGLWQNVLAFGLRDTACVNLIQTAWNVTAEARRLRQRALR